MKIAFLGDTALIEKYDISRHKVQEIYNRFNAIKPIINSCDYIIANLESPLTDLTTTKESKSMPLRSNSVNVDILKYLGISAVSIANNHIYDYGNKGIEDTICVLEQNHISYFGLSKSSLYLKDESILLQGFCCFTTNGWHYDQWPENGKLHALTYSNIHNFLKEANQKKCYPIAVIHWGDENTHYPKQEHIQMAQYMLKHGIRCIVGHHPHVVQGLMKLEESICAFSLGNFIFDDCFCAQNNVYVKQTEDNKKGFVFILEIKKNKLIEYKIIPYYDTKNGFVLSTMNGKLLEKYTQEISFNYQSQAYETLRYKEQQQARLYRLGKRDITWFKNHCNYNSVISVLQRKINQWRFSKELKKFN